MIIIRNIRAYNSLSLSLCLSLSLSLSRSHHVHRALVPSACVSMSFIRGVLNQIDDHEPRTSATIHEPRTCDPPPCSELFHVPATAERRAAMAHGLASGPGHLQPCNRAVFNTCQPEAGDDLRSLLLPLGHERAFRSLVVIRTYPENQHDDGMVHVEHVGHPQGQQSPND